LAQCGAQAFAAVIDRDPPPLRIGLRTAAVAAMCDVDAECAAAAEATARGVELLSGREFAALFPGARIYREKVLGLTKSFTAYAGW